MYILRIKEYTGFCAQETDLQIPGLLRSNRNKFGSGGKSA